MLVLSLPIGVIVITGIVAAGRGTFGSGSLANRRIQLTEEFDWASRTHWN